MDLIHEVLNILLPPMTLIHKVLNIHKSLPAFCHHWSSFRYWRVCSKAISLGSPDAISIVADVSKMDECKSFINQAINHFGRLDYLVNNAGIYRNGMFKNATQISNIIPVMDVNFWGTVYSTHLAIPHLLKRRGKIVVVASTCGWYPLPGLVIYNASKAALISVCETLRAELGHFEINSSRVSRRMCQGNSEKGMQGRHVFDRTGVDQSSVSAEVQVSSLHSNLIPSSSLNNELTESFMELDC
ncbi:hypothetical protein FNV43_RR21500 [Rhamnella rubrinervis]|uniref:Uncharacterized protein n=1 Tax=Rhamnella rubrinervis TaxID=2594499 RepID=A0A8K0E1S8_9ROSA|nr:hypothetical protein FNV43_RR21500 [Rhamnella rubrinervis]